MKTPVMTLKEGRDRSLLRKRPWIFSGAVAKLEGSPAPGASITINSHDGRPLAKAAFSPQSQIAARVWSFNPDDEIDHAFFRSRIADALKIRKVAFVDGLPEALRLVYAESDGLPGVIVDIYGRNAVCQLSTAGADAWRTTIAEALMETGLCDSVYERSDIESRSRECLPPRKGTLIGEAPPELIKFTESSMVFNADIASGHKTGFYLDQRDSRKFVMDHSAGASSVLNCFSYTGGFGIAALKGGAAKSINVDASASTLSLAAVNAQANGFDPSRFESVEADVFEYLRRCRDSRLSFDMIILDPPKFADSKSHAQKAARGYKDINLLAIKLLKPGGRLFTFSCSGAIDAPLFQSIVASAALDAGRELKFTSSLSQAKDHPVASGFPEASYLKGFFAVAL